MAKFDKQIIIVTVIALIFGTLGIGDGDNILAKACYNFYIIMIGLTVLNLNYYLTR